MASSGSSGNGAAATKDKEKEDTSTTTSAAEGPGALQMILYSLYFVAIFQGFYYAVLMAYGKCWMLTGYQQLRCALVGSF